MDISFTQRLGVIMDLEGVTNFPEHFHVKNLQKHNCVWVISSAHVLSFKLWKVKKIETLLFGFNCCKWCLYITGEYPNCIFFDNCFLHTCGFFLCSTQKCPFCVYFVDVSLFTLYGNQLYTVHIVPTIYFASIFTVGLVSG